MQNDWWGNLSREIQGYADTGNQQQFYSALKTACGPKRGMQYRVRSANVEVLFTEKSEILQRWAEHYGNLLNQNAPVDD